LDRGDSSWVQDDGALVWASRNGTTSTGQLATCSNRIGTLPRDDLADQRVPAAADDDQVGVEGVCDLGDRVGGTAQTHGRRVQLDRESSLSQVTDLLLDQSPTAFIVRGQRVHAALASDQFGDMDDRQACLRPAGQRAGQLEGLITMS
jgi:hypothetical protein